MRTIEIIKKSNELLLKDGVIMYVFVWDNDIKSFQNDYYYFIDEMKKNNIKRLIRAKRNFSFILKKSIKTSCKKNLKPQIMLLS